MRRFIPVLIVLSCMVMTVSVYADLIIIDGVVKSVDAEKRTITVASGAKERTLDVSSKAKISINGKDGTLDALKAGQNATLSYHDELEIVLKVEVGKVPSISPSKTAELLEVSELSTDDNAAYPWLSPNGLTIYWEKGFSNIWTASRRDPDSHFKDLKPLFKGRHPTLTADGKLMVLLVDGVLHATSRESDDAEFRRPLPITEFRNQQDVKNPCLSPDGLNLWFNRRRSEFAVSTRESLSGNWKAPRQVSIQFSGSESKGHLTWIYVLNDELTLLCSHEGLGGMERNGNIMVWTRESRTGQFSDGQYIQLPGIEPMHGRSPRYVESTGELFFTSGNMKGSSRISVVKNFTLPSLGG